MHPTKSITIDVHPRIHIGLISMHADAPRKNGGIGFAIEAPPCRVAMTVADHVAIADVRPRAFTLSEQQQLLKLIESVIEEEALANGVSVSLSGQFATHFGLGSGTAIRLALMEGLFEINGRRVDASTLIRRSGRGGTSGIGVSTYFSGGMVLDLGVPNDGSPFVPSSRQKPTALPVALPRLTVPDWQLCICIPKWITPKTQEQEVSFFSKTAPLRSSSSFEAAYEGLFGVYAAVMEGDYRAFCQSLKRMQAVDWKQAEWSEYGNSLYKLRSELYRCGADAVGLSSLGPLLFCFGSTTVLCEISNLAVELDCEVFLVSPRNAGREILRA